MIFPPFFTPRFTSRFALLFALLFSLVFLGLGFWGCSETDVDNTTFLTKIEKPVITEVLRTSNKVMVEVSLSYLSTQSDLQRILLLTNTAGGNFAAFENADKSEVRELSDLPSYANTSEQLSLSGNTFDVELAIGTEGLTENTSYTLGVVAYASNAFYARAKENNGWFFSAVSDTTTIYVSPLTQLTLTNYHFLKADGGADVDKCFAFKLKNDGTIDTICQDTLGTFDKDSSDYSLLFSLEDNNGVKPHARMSCAGGVGLTSPPNGDPSEIMLKGHADDGVYQCNEDIVTLDGITLLAKDSNHYIRIFYEEIDTEGVSSNTDEASITIKIFRSEVTSDYLF